MNKQRKMPGLGLKANTVMPVPRLRLLAFGASFSLNFIHGVLLSTPFGV